VLPADGESVDLGAVLDSSGHVTGVVAVRLERVAGSLSLAAGFIHGGVAPQHFAEWWGYGLFFLGAALAQAVYGLALLTDAVNERDFGAGWRRLRRNVYVAGIVGNLAIVALYVVTRTTGIPFFGPEAGEVEEVAFIDVVSKVAELALVGILFVLLRRARTAAGAEPASV